MNRKRRPKARKSRTKARKSKFLSLLRLQFPPNEPKEIERAVAGVRTAAASSDQLNLVPLVPEINNQVDQDRESHDHENVALYFSAADGGATTLTGLLDTSTAVESNSSHTINNTSRIDYLSQSSAASLTYAYSEERAALVRTALRSRDRDSSEEKWVCYSEVVERIKVKEEEVSSSAVDLPPGNGGAGIGRVSLKLDYEEIMNAWSNKGPLYIDAESSPVVPDINHQFASHDQPSNNGQGMGWGCNAYGGIWTVPEMVGNHVHENGEEMRKMMTEQREASVLRYKEKRQNRLFSNKIRYQVRKLNAEKRPRLKGRFVKRS